MLLNKLCSHFFCHFTFHSI